MVERRNTIPILANVVLQAADGALLMTATDMDMDIATQVEMRGRHRRNHNGVGASSV